MVERIDLQRVSASADNLIQDYFDLVIVGASWDQRCLAITRSPELLCEQAVVIQYDSAIYVESEDAHLEALRGYLAPRSATLDTIELSSTALSDGWSVLRQLLLRVAHRIGKPLRILVDLNSIPRYWTLGLLGYVAQSGLARSLSILYADAVEYAVPIEIGEGYSFTSGEWAPVAVPGLGRPSGAAANSRLIISGGFEGAKTRRLVHSLEPDAVDLVLAYSTGEHLSEARDANAGLLSDYDLELDEVLTIPLMDLHGLVGAIESMLTEKSPLDPEEAELLSFLLAGPKLVSLAMAVVALDTRVAQVYYVAPERRNISSSAEIGHYIYARVQL